MRRRMCFRCGAHLPATDFSLSQATSHSPWCRICEGWPAGEIPVRGMEYKEYVRFKIQRAMAKGKEDEL
jgi:hypothetical protein